MPPTLLAAVILFTVALLLYSLSVWSERLQKQLKPWHLVVFGLGVLTDVVATWLTIEFVGAIVFTPHAIFGFTSLLLMAVHFAWALVSYLVKDNGAAFHRFSVFVWSVWLLSYLTGMVSGVQKFW